MSFEPSIDLGLATRWSPFRQLHNLVLSTVLDKFHSSLELESTLTRYKADLLVLLKNPPRNELHKEAVVSAAKDGIMIVQRQNRHKTVIPQVIVDEALTMSEMFDLNELSALELIIAGENQGCRFPGMTRGPIAVLLYYDGRRSLLNSINLLVQSRSGRSWNLKLNSEILRIVNKFTSELKTDGVVLHCIEQLFSLDIRSEYQMLENKRALGTPKYNRQISTYLKEIRQNLADIIYNYSAQSDLNKVETVKLINLLSKKSELDSVGCFDSVTTTLIVSLLYQMDVNLLQSCEENDPRLAAVPLIRHHTLLTEIIKQIDSQHFVLPEIKSILKFAWSISAKILASFPISEFQINESEVEKILDDSIENNVFDALLKLINANLTSEEFYMSIVHNLISSFIALMPAKIKELKEKADEIGRIINLYVAEGILPPENIPKHFEKFLKLMTLFYSSDKFQLSKEFWLFIEKKEINNRQQLLGKFIKTTVESVLPTTLQIAVIKFLKALAKSFPFNVFNLIKTASLHHISQFSLEYFISSLNQYYESVCKQEKASPSQMTKKIYGISHKINLDENVLCAFLGLIEMIVKKDRNCCLAIAETQQNSLITTLISILRCGVTKEMKETVLNCLAGFSHSSSSVAFTIWTQMDVVLPKISYSTPAQGMASQTQMWQNSIAVEIEDIEPKNEEYSITLGFLNLFKSTLIHIGSNQMQQHKIVDGCLNFILNSILLKANTRTYKYEEEKWSIIKKCFKILNNFLESYEPLIDGTNLKGPFSILTQTLQEGNFFRFISFILEEIVEMSDLIMDHKSIEKSFKLMEKSATYALKFLNEICDKQTDFIQMLHDTSGFPVAIITSLDVLFCNVNFRTGLNDRLVTLVRMIQLPPSISEEAVKLLNSLCKNNTEIPSQLLIQVVNSKHMSDNVLINLFVECLDSQTELRILTLKLILTCLECAYGTSPYNFGHKILGFDKKFSIKEAGSMGQPFSCFHSILSFFDDKIDVIEHLKERKLGMQIIYNLCVSPCTFENVFRYIRTSHDFMINYLKNLTKRLTNDSGFVQSMKLLSEYTFFLQILTLEIKLTAQQNLSSYCSSYINFLLCDLKKRFLLQLLVDDVFQHIEPERPSLEYFELEEVLKAVSECSLSENSTVDLKALHQRLTKEVKSAASHFSIIHAKQVQEEIKLILNYAALYNEFELKLNEKKLYFESWRQLFETIVYVNALNYFSEEIRSRILLEVIHEMICRALSNSTVSSFLVPISSIIFTSSSGLYVIKNHVSSSNLVACIKSIMNLLESSSISFWNQQKRARIHLYAALLYLIRSFAFGLSSELKFGPTLLDKLCKDILTGHEIAKVLSIFLLNQSDSSWISEIASKGTLKLLMENLLSDDREIRANKCEFNGVFYTFDAKLILFHRICTSPNGIQMLFHLDPIRTISLIQCFDIYPHVLGQSIVCHKMFVNILRLLLILSTTANQQFLDEIGSLISSKSVIFNDIIRATPTIKEFPEGKEAISIVTRIVSRFATFASQGLQRNLIGLLSYFIDNVEDIEIIRNILYGCFVISRTNALTPLFAPSLFFQFSDVNFGQQPLGILITLLNNICSKWSDSTMQLISVEYSLYLLWHHFNLYLDILKLTPEEENQVELMKSQTFEMTELFAKLENLAKGNIFVGALIRRMKRIIGLKRK